MPLIELKQITKTYASAGVATPALRGVSLAIAANEFVAIMGRSGSGKSTLLHILGFLDRPSTGEYMFDEHPMAAYSELDLANIRNQKMGFVFQAFHLLPRTTVLENVMLPLRYSLMPKRERLARARQAIAEVDLTHREGHTTTQLSGGEKQRVAIARALVNNPKVIFADEPTGNLDSSTGEQVMQMIDALHSKGHTIVLITHETPTAQYAQRIIELKDGLVIEDKAVTERHKHYQK